MCFFYLFLSARIEEKCQEWPVPHTSRLSPLALKARYTPFLLELSHAGSLAGSFLTVPGTETCSCSGSLSSNNVVYMYMRYGNDKELEGGVQSTPM